MNPKALNTVCCITLALALAGPVCTTAVADPVPATATVPGDKLVTNFSGFAGSTENSASLVHGLRTGSPITLTDPAVAGGPPPTSTTFSSPTKPMGYSNIRIALSLAETQLASQGITNPTATELQGALMGSTTTGPGGTTTTDGILQMRASGMGWGRIANSMGYKLGPVMSGHQTFVPTTTTATTGRSSLTTATGIPGNGVVASEGKAAAGKGVVTGAGNATATGQSKGVTTGLGHASSSASGVTTAAGGKAGGVTTAAGGKAGGNAGGNGKAIGKS